MKNLVIGNTSQLSRYFPEDYIKISSRNIDVNFLKQTKWDAVYLCFAEQRTYLANSLDQSISELFWSTNFDKTKELVEDLQPVCNKIVYYSTAELWNKCNGPVQIGMPFLYHENHYTSSKHKITEELSNKLKYPKVSVAYPFNFNSVYRSDQYLFGKIFKSIQENKKISIGDTDYYRELLHPKMVVDGSIRLTEVGKDAIIGSGRLVHIGDFIRKLYGFFKLNYNDLVEQSNIQPSVYRSNIFYSAVPVHEYTENFLFDLITQELKQ